ncbi:MAG: ANTAR domain-containing protein [Lachnospiraceae bacterium]|nr:ANTAR domain-containing protein [Lachnospiraceae bacterium]MBR0154380.1 ANTAR domain-containing protein [Lachnospiraceae bacterium]
MSLKERFYSVLVVSASEKMNIAFSDFLSEFRCQPVRVVTSVSAGKRAWSERAYDFVIINSPLPDDPGVRFAIDIGGSAGVVVLLLVRAELHEEIQDRVSEHGVFTLAKPVSRPVLSVALGWMGTARERLRKLENKTLSVEEKMEEIRLVNRAKWLLISELKMEEPQAHRYIEKQAMDRCISKKIIAEEIIRTYS